MIKAFKVSLVLRARENTNVFMTFDENIYGIHHKRVNILYIFLFDHNLYLYRVSRKYLQRVESHGTDTIYNGQTNKQTDGHAKINMSPNIVGQERHH